MVLVQNGIGCSIVIVVEVEIKVKERGNSLFHTLNRCFEERQ